jgi:predicted chitinase
MEEVKSVRVRRRLASLDERHGNLDIKVTVYKGIGKKRSAKGFNNGNIVWSESIYDGDYVNQINNAKKETKEILVNQYKNSGTPVPGNLDSIIDSQFSIEGFIIDDFIRVNTLKERPSEGDKIKIFDSNTNTSKDVSYYMIVQDPWSDVTPVKRSFGFDPYYLGNGSQVYIKWLTESYDKLSYDISGMTASITASGSSASVIKIVVDVWTSHVNMYPDFDLEFDYNGGSQSEIDSVVSSVVDQSVEFGFTINGVNYPAEGQNIPSTLTYILNGGEQYSDNNMNEVNTPSNVIKRIEVIPPRDNNGELIDKMFTITDNNEFKYLSDVSSDPGLNQMSYSSTDKDKDILQKLIGSWKVKIPGYVLSLCEPNYQSCLLSEYKSPLKPVEKFDTVPATTTTTDAVNNPNPVTAVIGTASVPKTKLTVVFPTQFEAKVREDVPSFKIYIGEPPVEEEGSAFVLDPEVSDLSELSTEYTEEKFSGEEDLYIVEEDVDVSMLNDIKGFDPEKPNEILSTDTTSKYPLSKDKDANARAIIKAAKSSGVTNKYTITAILAIVSKESGFVPRSEASYGGTSATRIKNIFSKFRKYSDAEVDVIKKDPVKFFDIIYGGKYGNGEKDGYKFRGRGFNQITFKGNYKVYADETGLNLINDPDLLNTVDAASKCVVAYFKRNIKKAPSDMKSRYNFSDINSFKNLNDAVGAIYHANAGWGKSYSEIVADSTGGRKKAFDKSQPLYNTYQS